MKVFFLFCGLLLSCRTLLAQSCAGKIGFDEFSQLVKQVQSRHFPQIPLESVVVTTFEAEDYFLQAQPSVRTLIKNPEKRSYEIQLNLRLLTCSPGEEALEAILVHEFEHVMDYTQWSSAKILKHGLRYIRSDSFRARYERETDEKTLRRGLGQGLKQYREWIYQWLTPEQLETKKRFYYSPEEIQEWMISRE
jgi:hypothetical protein